MRFHRIARGRLQIVAIDVSNDVTGRQRIDANVFRRELKRQRFGELVHGRFRCGVSADTARHAKSQDRSHNHNRAGLVRSDQTARRFLRAKEDSIEIEPHHFAPVLLSLIDEFRGGRDPGIRDQYLNRAESLFGLRKGAGDGGAVRDIGLNRQRFTTCGLDGRDLGRELSLAAGDEGDLGSLRGQHMGEARAKPT